MPTYKAPVDDVQFLLNDVFHMERYGNLPGFADASPDVVAAILEEAAKFSEEVLSRSIAPAISKAASATPTAASPRRRASRKPIASLSMAAGSASRCRPNIGGQGLPATMTMIVNEMLASANMAFAMYPGLTQGAIAALLHHADDEQKKTYLPKMTTGEWTGTMNLTEPHCGTDLGMLRTKAVPQADGSYKITGTKIFISAGEHDLADNIIHLVLARIEGAPEGVKGISLFIVPKFLRQRGRLARRAQRAHLRLDRAQDGHPRQRDLRDELRRRDRLAGRRGEQGPQRHVHDDERGAARGRHAGPVAVRGRLSERRELRARAAAGPLDLRREGPDKPADPIIVHPDIRRTLMSIKSFNEAARALILWTALKGDVAASLRGREGASGGRRSHGPDDAGDQRRASPTRASTTRSRRSRCSAATATSASTAWSSSCAMPASR